MPSVDQHNLYQILVKNQLLPELKDGPTVMMLSVKGEPCRVSLQYDHGLVIAEGDSFVYTYEYPDDQKGESL